MGRRSQEAKAIPTSKMVVNSPEFTGKNLSGFAEIFGRFLRMTAKTRASGRVKCDLLLQCCKIKYLERQVKQMVTKSANFADVLVALERRYPTYKNAPLHQGRGPEPGRAAQQSQTSPDLRATG